MNRGLRHIPPEEVSRIYDAIQSVGKAALDAVKEENEHRRYGVSWNILDIVLYQIGYFSRPQGQLVNDLSKAVDDMDEDLPVEELVARGAKFLEKLLAMSKDELAEELYFVDKVVSDKQQPSLQNIQNNFKDNINEEARKAMDAKDFERCAVRLLYKFYEVLYYCDLPDDIDAVFSSALENAAERPVEDAAKVLFAALEEIMDGDFDDDDDETPDVTDLSALSENPNVQQMAQQMAQAMGADEIQQLQQQMAAAMMRGDMAEYMRLATELQQKIMGGCQMS